MMDVVVFALVSSATFTVPLFETSLEEGLEELSRRVEVVSVSEAGEGEFTPSRMVARVEASIL